VPDSGATPDWNGNSGIMPGSLRPLPGCEIERFGMGLTVMLGQGLTEVAGPLHDRTATDPAAGDWKMGNGHRGTAER
jgi:hypothetical protein